MSKNHHRILIVEDNADVRHYIQSSLLGFTIYEAADGKEGLKLALTKMPDLIISDVMMPNMDGFEMCRHIKEDERISHIPVVLLTARADKADKITGWETGADEYIPKPFDIEELTVRIVNLINQREHLKKHFLSDTGIPLDKLAVTSTDQKFLNRLQEVLEREIDNPNLDINTILNELQISRTHLYNKLKALVGLSANSFIRIIRLKRAALMLEQNAGNITDVAYAVGFTNPAYFSECFRKQFGKTPSQYVSQNSI
jgi:DNA-binding response OmpR family regulator